jgi:hypothetical protein
MRARKKKASSDVWVQMAFADFEKVNVVEEVKNMTGGGGPYAATLVATRAGHQDGSLTWYGRCGWHAAWHSHWRACF